MVEACATFQILVVDVPGLCAPPKPISLVFIDDHPSAHAGVMAQIRARQELHLVTNSVEARTGLQQVRRAKPDLVLLELRRKPGASLTLAGTLHRSAPRSRVIITSMDPLHDDVASFIRAGVSGFIIADASFDTLLNTIHSVAQGIQVLPAELTRSLFAQLQACRN